MAQRRWTQVASNEVVDRFRPDMFLSSSGSFFYRLGFSLNQVRHSPLGFRIEWGCKYDIRKNNARTFQIASKWASRKPSDKLGYFTAVSFFFVDKRSYRCFASIQPHTTPLHQVSTTWRLTTAFAIYSNSQIFRFRMYEYNIIMDLRGLLDVIRKSRAKDLCSNFRSTAKAHHLIRMKSWKTRDSNR